MVTQLLAIATLCFCPPESEKGFSFKVAPGEVVSLVGKSGAGKTTVLRCITGLEKCDKGTIEINGKYICSMENGLIKRATKEQLFEVRKDLGMVFQNYLLPDTIKSTLSETSLTNFSSWLIINIPMRE